jgi:hypothetical protein
VAKKLLSEQFREQLQALGSSLGAHTRSLDQHFDNQEAFLALRHQELEEAAAAMLPAGSDPSRALEDALAPLVKGDLNLMTVHDLRRLCSQNGMKGYSKHKKGELVALLQTHGISAPALSVKKLSRPQLEVIVEAVLKARE